jgi:hypothetical protein
MNLQEAFDTVATHLLTQNARCSRDGSKCLYKDDLTGRKCAVGALIPDHLYFPELEDLGAIEEVWAALDNSEETDPYFYELANVGHYLQLSSSTMRRLLIDLQALHDHKDPRVWSFYLGRVAAAHGLSVGVLESFS